uniref:G_PROTEIN_RECEP_F1_2 domain-containing protein n=1 Tax=Parastrongyloides trichosuri TaxID=131310 RepID=A0A0N4ZDY3_PARTI
MIQFIIGLITVILTTIPGIFIFFDSNYFIVVVNFFVDDFYNYTLSRVIFVLDLVMVYTTIAFPFGVLLGKYLVLCKNQRLTNYKVFLITFLCVFLSLIMGHAVLTVTDLEISDAVFSIFLHTNKIKSSLLNNNTKFLQFYLKFVEAPLYFIIIYLSSFIIVRKYKNYMIQYKESMSCTTKKIHNDFLKIIILQSSIPLLLSGPPALVFICFVVTGQHNRIPFIGDYIIKLFSTIPSINALLFIFLPNKSRELVFSFIIKKSKVSSTSLIKFIDVKPVTSCVPTSINHLDNKKPNIKNERRTHM